MSDIAEYVPNLDFVGQKFPAEVEYKSEQEALVTATLPDGFVVVATDSNRQNHSIEPALRIIDWNPKLSNYSAVLSYILEG